MNWVKGKGIDPQNSSGSDSEKDEPFLTEDGCAEHCNEVKGETGSPWQRMKWTDAVIRLLISVVASIDDDGLADGGAEGSRSKYGCLHKKGKWKMVSKIMISKGCRVSPQQCEDKFNDLNKRYKKLNDILGRNISCSVVENLSLMDSMTHLSAKAKDEVRKILSSKHLFYKEMCAYHNGQNLPDCHYLDHQGSALMPIDGCLREITKVDDDGDGDDDDDENYSSDESDDDDSDSDDEDGDNSVQASEQHIGLDSLRVQLSRIFKDPTKSQRERKYWIGKQKLAIHKQRGIIQARAFQIDKQCFKWLRYCNKKNEELERLRMENEAMRIENEQSLLRLKQKELELGLQRPGTYLDCSYRGTGNHH